MNTLIVPVDFSETSLNAARYAASLSNQLVPCRVVLYHSTIATLPEKELSKASIHNDADKWNTDLITNLREVAPETEFINIVDDGFIFEKVQALVNEYKALLIIMGITGKNKLQQKLIGSNTIHIALQATCPVLIVPPRTTYQPIKQVGVALQLEKNLVEHVPHEAIKSLVNALNASLMVIHVEPEYHATAASILLAGQQAAHRMFDSIGATYHLLDNDHIAESIADYALDNDAQLVISIAHEHGFIQQLFKGSVTRDLAFYATLPVIVFGAKKPD